MGQKSSRLSQKGRKSKKGIVDIPSDSPLGVKLVNWSKDPLTKDKDKAKIIPFCMFDWTKEEIKFIGQGMDTLSSGYARLYMPM